MRFACRLFVAALLISACNRPVHRSTGVVAISTRTLPEDPADAVWQDAPEFVAKLLPQDLVEPRLMQASTPEVLVRAITNGSEIAFRLEWQDNSKNDLPGAGQFIDACGVQIPARIESEPPDPQMGAPTKPVEITFWRADWQAMVNGREDSVKSLFPNAAIDHYPFDAPPLDPDSPEQREFEKRYAPSDALGNRRVGLRETAVEDLVAEGPSTLSPAAKTVSRGIGVHSGSLWSVVIVRPLPAGLSPPSRTQVAFAVWQATQNEVGARKMRSGWVSLGIEETK